MQEPDEPREPDSPETTWKSQPEDQTVDPRIALSPDELCAMVRSREKLNARVAFAVKAAMVIFAGAFLYNIYRIDQPWIRLGQAWTLGVIVYLFGPMFERGQRPSGASETCARFLERQHEERRSGYLLIRRRLFLFIPGIAACWWGRPAPKGPGNWLFLLTGAALVLVWLAFGKAAEKAAHDREEIRRCSKLV